MNELREELNDAIESVRTSMSIDDAMGRKPLPRHNEAHIVDIAYALLSEIPDHWTVMDVVAALHQIRMERGQ